MTDNFLPNKISIQIPTRQRSHHMINVINNILDKVSDPNNIEILLRMDDDDMDSVNIIKNTFPQHIGHLIKILVGNRGGGYYDLPKFHYELSEQSAGEWIFLYNDDVIMDTKNFDLFILENHNQKIILQSIGENGGSHGGIAGGNWFFPIIHRDIVKNLGHFTIDTPYADGWIRVIGEKLNLHKIIPIKLHHLMEIRNFMDDVNIDKTNINNTSGLKFNWSYHINDPNGLIYKDVEKLKSIYNI
jgi:hypothetical protein